MEHKALERQIFVRLDALLVSQPTDDLFVPLSRERSRSMNSQDHRLTLNQHPARTVAGSLLLF
jgi:hypothetical protein